MLDEPTMASDTPADPGLPTPPRGRRSASRPAGPPKPAAETSSAGFEEELQARLDAQLVAKHEEVAPTPEVAAPPATEPPAPPRKRAPRKRAARTEEGEVTAPRTPRTRKKAAAAPPDPVDEAATAPPADPADAEAATVAEPEHPVVPDVAAESVVAPTVADQPGDEHQTPPDQGEDEDSAEDEETGARRRRRRRGGRRRRRAGTNPDPAADSETGDEDAEEAEEAGSEESAEEAAGEDGNGEGRRRRRRRRRRGEDTGGTDDSDADVVVKVREPRRGKVSDEVTGIEGSTRMEAKRQRRREGRAAGRRRSPILSEAEFLARRESVNRTMVIRQNEELAQLAVLEDNVLVEHYVDRASATSLIGNVYLGRVQNVLPSMEAAFIDIGRGRNAVLYAGEVDWDSFGAEGQQRKVERVLKSGQTILVQVTKDPVGAKGARLTNHISLPGRYIVYSPGGHLSGISRKLSDTERRRLKEILGELVGQDASVIVRTAAEGASEEELVRDVNRLKAQWEAIEKKVKAGQAPQQLYAEPDATVRIVRDLFTEDFTALIIDGNGTANDAYDTVTAYVAHVAPHLAERIERWDPEKSDVFAAHRIDEQISKALERKVYLPSGGSLIIDRTEAMTVIDVNTGKFTGSGGNLEATVTSNNLEAAEEVVRQLRLRDIGGIIVIDFIDMVLPTNRELLLRRLVECLGRDRTRHQVAEVTSLGLVQMTRKRIGTGLAEAFTEVCDHCKGRGYEIHELPVDSQTQADGGERRRSRRGSKGDSNEAATEPSGEGNGRAGRRRRGRDAQPAEQSPEQPTEHSVEQSAETGPVPDSASPAEQPGDPAPDAG